MLTWCALTRVWSVSQGFYVGLRLVACAQSGHEVSLSSLHLTVPPPKFVSMTSSVGAIQCCCHFIQRHLDFTHSNCKDNITDLVAVVTVYSVWLQKDTSSPSLSSTGSTSGDLHWAVRVRYNRNLSFNPNCPLVTRSERSDLSRITFADEGFNCVVICSLRRRISLMGFLKVCHQSVGCCRGTRLNRS